MKNIIADFKLRKTSKGNFISFSNGKEYKIGTNTVYTSAKFYIMTEPVICYEFINKELAQEFHDKMKSNFKLRETIFKDKSILVEFVMT